MTSRERKYHRRKKRKWGYIHFVCDNPGKHLVFTPASQPFDNFGFVIPQKMTELLPPPKIAPGMVSIVDPTHAEMRYKRYLSGVPIPGILDIDKPIRIWHDEFPQVDGDLRRGILDLIKLTPRTTTIVEKK